MDRQQWMSVLARAEGHELAVLSKGILPLYSIIRGPEAGLVMLRGRAGGTGAAFNLGEATVARCTVLSGSGHLGHAYCLGRDLRQAELAAAIDAGLQEEARREQLFQQVVIPLAEGQAAKRELSSRRAAATQVQFFTMSTMRT